MGGEKYKFSKNDGSSFSVDDGNGPSENGTKCKVISGITFLCAGFLLGFVVAWFSKPAEEAFVTPTTASPSSPPGGDGMPEVQQRRIDCYPEAEGGFEEVTAETCRNRGCMWAESEYSGVPSCYVPQPEDSHVSFGYKVTAEPDLAASDTVQTWYLERQNHWAIYGENLRRLTFQVEYFSDSVLRFKFDDADDQSRYKVPVPLHMSPTATNSESRLYRVEVNTTHTFSFRIIRVDTGTVLWDSSVGGFAFTNQFLQISTSLPSSNVYGFGENLHWSLRHNMSYKTWPMFSRDEPPNTDSREYQKNYYSVHPYYECVEKDGNVHGVLLLNSNAMDYTLSPYPMLTYKTIGGILDFYMFLGPTPENVVQQYTGLIGRPYMPPYFMLGFQLCRYGYKNTSMVKDSVDRMLAYNIPYDVQYIDIDHMYKQRDFTLDTDNFGDLPEYFHQLRDMGLRTVIILDPALEINDTYRPYVEGREEDIYIQWPDRDSMPEGDYEEYNRTDMMGYVWPEWKVVFPDFFLNETAELWTKWIVNFTSVLPFDALWVDMNEPANFGTNEWKPWNWPEDDPRNWSLKCPESMWDDPPYRTKAAYAYDSADKQERLSGKTLCMVGTQEKGATRHYDAHSLYGWKQSQVSLQSVRAAVKQQSGGRDLRSMVVSRSTFPGSAVHAGRWLGDNKSTWTDLWLSIIGMLEFNIMGFPYIGADICGFFGNTDPTMCMRWQELGAFYPYSRNHNHKDSDPQDPGYFGDMVANRTRETMLIRYKLLPYLYTLFHKAHTEGSTVVRPLFHEFPTDSNTYAIDGQFLWGSALMIVPILHEAAEQLKYYMPRGRWYDWYTFGVSHESKGQFYTIDVNDAVPIQLHIRGGCIIPWQEPANTTQYSRVKPFGLTVALDSGSAEGQLFWDDGDSIDTYENGNYYLARFNATMNTLKFEIAHNGIMKEMETLFLNTVHILGLTSAETVYINGTQHHNLTFEESTQVLNIMDLQIPMSSEFHISWS